MVAAFPKNGWVSWFLTQFIGLLGELAANLFWSPMVCLLQGLIPFHPDGHGPRRAGRRTGRVKRVLSLRRDAALADWWG